jgi:hypothetical protein
MKKEIKGESCEYTFALLKVGETERDVRVTLTYAEREDTGTNGSVPGCTSQEDRVLFFLFI